MNESQAERIIELLGLIATQLGVLATIQVHDHGSEDSKKEMEAISENVTKALKRIVYPQIPAS